MHPVLRACCQLKDYTIANENDSFGRTFLGRLPRWNLNVWVSSFCRQVHSRFMRFSGFMRVNCCNSPPECLKPNSSTHLNLTAHFISRWTNAKWIYLKNKRFYHDSIICETEIHLDGARQLKELSYCTVTSTATKYKNTLSQKQFSVQTYCFKTVTD